MNPTATSAAPAASSLLDAARSWAQATWEDVEGEPLLTAAEQLCEARRLLDAALLGLTDRLEETGAARTAGWSGTKELLAHLTGGQRGSGSTWVRTARQLRELPQVQAALAQGRLSGAQARAVGAAVASLPAEPVLRGRVADELLALADQGAGATELQHAVADVVRAVDPQGAALAAEQERDRAERGAHRARFLSFSPDGLGGVRVKGYGTVEDAECLRSVLHALAAPVTTEPGACGGQPRAEGRSLAERRDHPRVPCPDPECDHTGRDPREAGARLWDALVEVCGLVRDADRLPRDHGARPRVMVTIDADDLVRRVGAARYLDGTPLSAAALRRLACDAEILPAVLGSEGQVLDVGRASRLVTPALWNALLLRDHHCAFPGCTRLPTACDAHHVQHWADGGATSLANLVMLCRHHHRLVHHSPWRVRIDPDTGKPVWTPPPRAVASPSPTLDGRRTHPPPRAA